MRRIVLSVIAGCAVLLAADTFTPTAARVLVVPEGEAADARRWSSTRLGCAPRSTPSSWPNWKPRAIAPGPAADKIALIRRATFDLIGLPPTPEEVDAFLADKSPQAFEKVVDRLLASPQYGERWGRHWLDLARYAESEGFKSRRNAAQRLALPRLRDPSR